MIRTIVTPIDGSQHADMALDLGIDLAARYGAHLILLHVGDGNDDVPEALYATAARELEEVEAGGQETGIPSYQPQYLRGLEYMGQMLLRDARARAEAKGVAQVETAFVKGEAGERIIQIATDRSANLIVMGSRGFGTLKGLVLGSVSNKVFHLAPCSCVTVKRRDAEPALDGVGTILVPTDGSASAGKAVDLAGDIAAKYGARVVLLYAMWRGPSLEQLRNSVDIAALSRRARDELDPARHPIAEHAGAGLFPPLVTTRTFKEIGRQVLESASQAIKTKGAPEPHTVLREGDPARTIVNVAGRRKADLIAMGSRGLGMVEGLFAGSVSYKVNQASRCSCLIVR